MIKMIYKPWGKEEIITKDKNYVLKRITMNKNCQCSLQFHKKKNETIFIISGKLKVFFGKSKDNLKYRILKPNNFLQINSPLIHRMFGIERTIYLEASSNHLKDIVRIEDDYGR